MHMSNESLLVVLMVGTARWMAGRPISCKEPGSGSLAISSLESRRFHWSWLLLKLGIHLGMGIVAAITKHISERLVLNC